MEFERIMVQHQRSLIGNMPRVNGSTIDYVQTVIQPGNDKSRAFSYETTKYTIDLISN